MKNSEITLGQIINQPFGDESADGDIITETHAIIRHDDHPNTWSIYDRSQEHDSDPEPLLETEDPKEVIKFFNPKTNPKELRGQEIKISYEARRQAMKSFIEINLDNLDNGQLSFIRKLIDGDISIYKEKNEDYTVTTIR